ncbi:lytic transglycosylase [Hyphomicrobium methylovorum]|uniref:lytic murein transglycosylase n=1 Tax=Hyphomicrobium methylovorum TaxID=84 RepID=UPI0015E673A9|nr:lytic murein transglycosylase [Hyphomicrobium methylovorum]MBA2125904.1 lytic transglycosylase [Hyphomicrobium methylovorum]
MRYDLGARRGAKRKFAAFALALSVFALPTAGVAAQCGNGPAGFNAWLEQFKSRAAAQGIKPGVIASSLAGVTYDPRIIRLDRGQHSFKLSFEQFYARRVSNAMIARGRALMQKHRATINRIEQRYGVPGAVVIAIWGLETHYGADTSGRYSIIRSLATLAYDCRRSEFFTGQLMDALRIVARGDLSPSELRGGWAGEIGQTQFLPTPYMRYAVDFDGNGHRDLIHSVPDMLASTANYLAAHGWKRGGSWEPGSANYAAIAAWNKATVYQRTISVMASKIDGR